MAKVDVESGYVQSIHAENKNKNLEVKYQHKIGGNGHTRSVPIHAPFPPKL